MATEPLNLLASEEERREWMKENAEYFTVMLVSRRLGGIGRYKRKEYPTLKKAYAAAKRTVNADGSARLMIYAVHGSLDAYIATVDYRTK